MKKFENSIANVVAKAKYREKILGAFTSVSQI